MSAKTKEEWKADPLGMYDLHLDVTTTPEATVAVLTGWIDGENYTWTGVSKRFPGDRYAPGIGVKLASGRALLRAAKQLIKQGNGLVKNMDDNRERQAQLATRPNGGSPRYHRISPTRSRERSQTTSA